MAEKQNIQEVDVVLNHIRDLLYSGRLVPGDRLPSERRLSEQLVVSRAHVRVALQRLEFYGLVKTFPQSGTVVAHMNTQQVESLLTDMLKIDRYDFASLVDVRILLELEAARLCAMRRNEEDLAAMESALNECERVFETDQRVAKDFAFHQAIARGAHNPVIASLLLVITPDVLKYYQKYKVCSVPSEEVIREHRNLLRYIKERNAEAAADELRKHLSSLYEFSQTHNTVDYVMN